MKTIKTLKKELIRIGKDIVGHGLTYAHFGNISVSLGGKIIITKKSTRLDRISNNSLATIELSKIHKEDSMASFEAPIHREIYKGTGVSAVLHVHAPFSTALSMVLRNKIKPIDSEGKLFLKEIPIVKGMAGTPALGKKIAAKLAKGNAVIHRGHGIFTAAGQLTEALDYAVMAEYSARVLYYKTVFQSSLKIS